MKESLIVVRGPLGIGKTSVALALRDLMPDHSSLVETDAIKRMIDPNQSSEWRRDLAHSTAAFIVAGLLQVPRTAIVEAHTKYPEQLDRLAQAAKDSHARLVNVLLTAPLAVCEKRAAQRLVPGITYAIDTAMVRNYYCNLDPRSDDLVYDTTQMTADEIAQNVVTEINRT